jgi:hypothetical protein
MIKQSGSSPRVEDEERTARAMERRLEVVFTLLIFRLDLLFLLKCQFTNTHNLITRD